jgi:hypothetical protein
MSHCSDNEGDRRLGAYWEEKFCIMAKALGHVYTPHQLGLGRIAACAHTATGRIVLPDITIWSGPGQHHEVKHKNPARTRCFGLEAYRFNSLLAFANITAEPVYYTIHNWELAGGRDVRTNRIDHWVTCDTDTLYSNRGAAGWGDSWVGGEKRKVQILYWPVAYFRPLLTLWRRQPGIADMLRQTQLFSDMPDMPDEE